MPLMDMRVIVGSNFARIRKERGLTQERVAELSGFTQSYIGWLERGKRNPTVISVFHLAEALGVTPTDLVAPLVEIEATLR